MSTDNQYEYEGNEMGLEEQYTNSEFQGEGYYDSYDTNEYGGGNKRNIPGMIGMILGIVGCVNTFCCCKIQLPFLAAPKIAFGIAALVLGIVGSKKTDCAQGMAKAAFVMGIVIIALAIVSFIMSLIGNTVNIFSDSIINALQNASPQFGNILTQLMTP